MSPLIQFKNTSFQIHSKKIIDDFSTNILPDDFVVILGSNGSGKSTLLKLLNRTYKHTGGEILFHGKPIQTYNANALQQKMISISQFMPDSLFTDLTVEENAILIESSYLKSMHQPFHKKSFLHELPSYLTDFNPNLPSHIKTKVGNLSGGEQQILAFALYLRRNPDVVLLDEHTSALDPKKSKMVMDFIEKFIKKKGIACLMTTHQLEYALQYGNRLIAIKDGQLAFDANRDQKPRLCAKDLLAYCY